MDKLSHQSDYRDGSCDNENMTLIKPEFLAVQIIE